VSARLSSIRNAWLVAITATVTGGCSIPDMVLPMDAGTDTEPDTAVGPDADATEEGVDGSNLDDGSDADATSPDVAEVEDAPLGPDQGNDSAAPKDGASNDVGGERAPGEGGESGFDGNADGGVDAPGDGTTDSPDCGCPYAFVCRAHQCVQPDALTAGQAHTCAHFADNTVACWGYNGAGALGNGSTASSTKPVSVSGLPAVTSVVAGDYFTCAITATAQNVYCWGDNRSGQLGEQTAALCNGAACSTTPVIVAGLSGVEVLAAGSNFACARLATGGVKCWGDNTYGQLGNGQGAVGASSTDPVDVYQLSRAIGISAAGSAACATVQGDAGITVNCWGYDGDNELGDGQNRNSSVPVAVPNVLNAGSIASGAFDDNQGFACTLITQGNATSQFNSNYPVCWGANAALQLGSSDITASGPIADIQLYDVSQIALGNQHACVLVAGGIVECWGDDEYGQLASAAATHAGCVDPCTPTAEPVELPDTAKVLAAGGDHNCVIVSSGPVFCWGANDFGQLGSTTSDTCGTIACSLTPASVEW